MVSNNSESGFYLDLVLALHEDIAQCYNVAPDQYLAEMLEIIERVGSEGLRFLTVTLPQLGKAVDRALSSDTRLATSGFALRDQSRIPAFFGWVLERVFDDQGWELCNSDPIALKDIRQFMYIMYKLEIPYDEETEKSALVAFAKTDRQVGFIANSGVWHSDWIVQARNFVTRVVSGLDPLGIIPKHGPGSVATGEEPPEKSNLRRIYPALDAVYPFTEYMMFNVNHVAESLPRNVANTHWVKPEGRTQYLDRLEMVAEPIARLVLVPKDSRGPRLISCEPLELQWIQQGLKDLLQRRIESSRYTRGHVNFTDQETNRRLALLGSTGSGWVTLDMKDASDRVSTKLVKTCFEGHPRLLEALFASRSVGTSLPDGTVMRFNKFAPMGSSLCFPVESLLFYALAVSLLYTHRRLPWRKAREVVYVYGDDIICREEDYSLLLEHMPSVGLKFNVDKCCTGRFFRESCGCDAHKGVDITPVKIKTRWSQKPNPEAYVSYVAFSNAMQGRGYLTTVDVVRKALAVVYGEIPYTNTYKRTSNGSFVSEAACPAYVNEGAVAPLNQHLKQRPVVRRKGDADYCHGGLESYVWKVEPVKWPPVRDSYEEMLRRFTADWYPQRGVYTVPRRNCLNRGWVIVR